MATGELAFVLVENSSLEIRLSGAWNLRGGLPQAASLQRELDRAPQVKTVAFETAGLSAWDSSVLAFLAEVSELCRARGLEMNRAGLPAGLSRLLELAEAVPEKKGARQEAGQASMLERMGGVVIRATDALGTTFAFLGEMTLTAGQFVR